jgi:hypothetical protein
MSGTRGRKSSVASMKASTERQQKRTADNAYKLASASIEGQFQCEFAPYQAPSAMIAMRNEMQDAIAELQDESRGAVEIHRARELLRRAGQLLSDAQQMMEAQNREMRAFVGLSRAQQWNSMRLDQPVEMPDLPAVPRAAAAMFDSLTEPPNAATAFTFRAPQ